MTHTLSLRFAIESQVELERIHVALEDADKANITWNGVQVDAVPDGYYVDASIMTVPLPGLKNGRNSLELVLPFGRKTNTEWCYLLGDFHVHVAGCSRILLPFRQSIGFSSVTAQGLPYYGGNITYQMEADTPDCALGIAVPHYRGAVIRAALDGKDVGVIAYDPYELVVEAVSAGRHMVELTLFGTRFNTFGGLHNTDADDLWAGPDYWRTKGDRWCYEYRLRDMGIISSPVLRIYQPDAGSEC